MKKYILTDVTRNVYGRTLFQIKAIRNFGNVKKGDLGGYIEKEENLSHCENAWVYDDACIYGNAFVYGNARVYVNAHVFGNARVYGSACVYGNDTWVYDNACICDNARVYGNDTCVSGNVCIYGNARVYGSACVYGNDDILWISKIGSRYGTTTFFKNKNQEIFVKCGCFRGNIDQFEEAVHKTHAGTRYEKEYMLAIELAKLKILGDQHVGADNR